MAFDILVDPSESSSYSSTASLASMPLARMIDVHTHIYPPVYLALLRSRTTVPYLLDVPPGPTGLPSPPRLIILPSDDDPSLPIAQRGRPIDSNYSSIHHKLSFMDNHNIELSVISLANPWLDFLPADESLEWARKINDELNSICNGTGGRLNAFGTLPLRGSTDDVVMEVSRLKELKMKGVIMVSGFSLQNVPCAYSFPGSKAFRRCQKPYITPLLSSELSWYARSALEKRR